MPANLITSRISHTPRVRWHSTQQRFNPLFSTIPHELKPWLLASGSLTCQLTQLAAGQFSVQPLQQDFERILRHESQLMQTPAYQHAWVREVNLYGCESKPWIKARSVIPLTTLEGQGLRLRYLKNKSLGSLLFARTKPSCIRQIALLPEGWTRRSLYIWHKRPLIVQETFLPQFQQFLLK